MKKFISVLIVVVMLAMLAGCEGEKKLVSVDSDLSQSDAYKMYVNAIGTIKAADSYSGDNTLRTSMAIMDDPYEYSVKTGVKHVFGSGDNYEVELKAEEGEMLDSMHYKNGTLYYTAGEDKIKFSFSGEDFMKMTNSKLVTEVLFKESAIYLYDPKEDAGGHDILFGVHSAGMEDVLRDFANYSVTGGFDEHGEDLSWEFSDDVDVYVKFDKAGNLRDILLSFVMVMDHVGEYIDTYIELGMIIKQVGGVRVEFPRDLDSYIDQDELYP
ncbi:MAG: hypothetical protein LBH28_05105 [Oscillospiraceae bacterium]|jgi:hypothetical protein|nr:hypothetical protein [Oscillospiraceae bacterium]